MTDREKAIVMAYTGVLMLKGDKLGIFYQYVREKLGHCVMTHELAFPEVQDAITNAAKNDFIELAKGNDASTHKPDRDLLNLIDDLRTLADYMEEMKIGKSPELIRQAADRLEEQDERIAIMRESMEAMERRLAAAEGKQIEAKSIDQMAYVGWMHEDQKLGLSEEE